MRTTHATYFNGGSITAGYYFTPKLLISLGAEYSYDYYHNDNGWNLYNLKFLPVFIDAKVVVGKERAITPFIQLSQGLSFINYRKEDQQNVFAPYQVSETGYYVYGGGGVWIKIGKYISFQMGVGFKAFHMSTYALEVNPHGLTGRCGFAFRF